jgi:hypothetical protein
MGTAKAIRLLCAIGFIWLAGERSAHAAMVTFDYTIEFSGATAPVGPAPWLRAVFNDDVDNNGYDGFVTLSLTALNLTGSEFVPSFYFNLNPTKNVSSLSVTGIDTSDVAWWTVSKGTNAYKADGDGLYDLRFNLPTGGSQSGRFKGGDELVYKIGGISGLKAMDFNYLSHPDGGKGPFLTAAKVQGIGPSGSQSGWVAGFLQNGGGGPSTFSPVPEPGSLLLLGSGLMLAGRSLRKRRLAGRNN